jgi:hypothetical protein
MRIPEIKRIFKKDLIAFERRYIRNSIRLQKALKLEAYGCVLNYLEDKQPENKEMIYWTKRKIRKIKELAEENLYVLKNDKDSK